MIPEFSRYLERFKQQAAAHYIAPRFRTEKQSDEPNHNLGLEQLMDRVESGGPRTWYVIGPAGAGKTTLTTHAGIYLLTRSVACLRLDARSIKQLTDAQQLVEAKEIIRRGRPADVDEALWKSRVKKQRLVLLIDGVNELRRLYGDTARWSTILELLAGNHPFPVLATSRQEVEELEEVERRDVTLLSLERLNQDDIEAYVEYRGLDPSKTLAQIRASKMEGATWNPFFLKLLVDHLLSRENPEFPRSRAALLEMTIQHAMKPGRLAPDEQRLKAEGLDLHAVACAAALMMFARQDGKAFKRDIVDLLERVWGKGTAIDHLVEAFLETHMVERSETLDSFEFLHEALVDFGVSLGFRDELPPAFAFDPEITDQFLGNWVGLARNPDDAAQFLIERTRAERRLDLLFDVILSNRGILTEATQEALWIAAGEGLTTLVSRPVRDASARHLAAFPREIRLDGIQHQVLKPLRLERPELVAEVHHALLQDTMSAEWLQRKWRNLLRHRREERSGQTGRTPLDEGELDASAGASPSTRPEFPATSDLIKTLLEDTVRKNRGAAASMLGQLGDPSAVPALLHVLRTDADEKNRGAAATALGKLGDRRAVPKLIEALREDPSPDGRGSAATALGRLGDRAAVPALSQTLPVDPDPIVRGAAASALGQLGDSSAVSAMLEMVRTDADEKNRGAAATALGKLGDRRAVPKLIETLSSDPSPEGRGSASSALGKLADRRAVPKLIELLQQDTDPLVRSSAATALGQLGDLSAIPALIEALSAEADDRSRSTAATALGTLGDRRAVPKLIEMLRRDPNFRCRGASANALRQIGDRTAVPALAEALLKDTEPIVRGAAAMALGQLGDRSIISSLQEALTDSTPSVRRSAITAAGLLQAKELSEPIRMLLLDPQESHQTRVPAARALAQISPSMLPVLRQAADGLRKERPSGEHPETKKTRGIIVALVGRHTHQEEDFEWLEKTARYDSNPINRREALHWLSLSGRATDDLLLFMLDPNVLRLNGRVLDTVWAVIQVAVAAVLRRYAGGGNPSEQLINAALVPLTHQHCPWATVNAALAVLQSLSLHDATRALDELTLRAHHVCSPSAFIAIQLRQQSEFLEKRKRVHRALLEFHKEPVAILKRFKPSPQFTLEERMSQVHEADVAVITALNEETTAVLGAFNALGITFHAQVLSERYYYVGEVPRPGHPNRTVRVVVSQGTQKGALSSHSLTTSLLSHFKPRWILLAGICGGLDERGANIGDVIVATNVFHYEPEKLIDDGGGLRPVPYACDPFILRAVQHLIVTGRMSGLLAANKILTKAYASGEKVLASRGTPLRQKILDISHDVAGFEMEAPGMLHAIAEAFKGSQYFAGGVIKAVCDLGDENMDASKKNGNRALALEQFAKLLMALLPEFDKDAMAGPTAA